MRIGVNYRLGLNPPSGIPLTIIYLYSQLSKIAPAVSFVKFVPFWNLPSLFFDTLVCYFLLVVHPVDIFHGPSYTLPWWKPRGTKFVVTVHDLAFLVHPEVATRRFRFIYRLLTSHSLSVADLVIAVSHNTKLDILKYFNISKEKIIVIPNGISDTYLSFQPHPPVIKEHYILTITTHPQRKNTLLLIQAFRQVSYRNDLKLVIAGNLGENHKHQLEFLAGALGLSDRILFTGGVTEEKLASLYQHARLFVYPSIYEGFGVPLLEAMSCGCLVLGTNTSSLPEIVPDSRCLFSPLTAETLASAISKLLSLSPRQKAQIIRKHKLFASNFSWTNSAQKYLSVFNQLTRGHK